jgi:hypothetical protein
MTNASIIDHKDNVEAGHGCHPELASRLHRRVHVEKRRHATKTQSLQHGLVRGFKSLTSEPMSAWRKAVTSGSRGSLDQDRALLVACIRNLHFLGRGWSDQSNRETWIFDTRPFFRYSTNYLYTKRSSQILVPNRSFSPSDDSSRRRFKVV